VRPGANIAEWNASETARPGDKKSQIAWQAARVKPLVYGRAAGHARGEAKGMAARLGAKADRGFELEAKPSC
jgi:hypothetical protein